MFYISLAQLGELTQSDDWTCWTSPEDAAACVQQLENGIICSAAILHPLKEGDIEVNIDFDIPLLEGCYEIPEKGFRCSLLLSESLTSESRGNYLQDEEESGETFAHRAKGILFLSKIENPSISRWEKSMYSSSCDLDDEYNL